MIKIELEKLLDGRSLYWLSQQTGVRWATISAMASGKAHRLEIDTIDLICEALRCEPGDLLKRVKSSKRRQK